jgi:hypothetical protein
MEHRDDLEDTLMRGLPESEQRHIAEAIDRTNAAKLRHLKERGEGLVAPGSMPDPDTPDPD